MTGIPKLYNCKIMIISILSYRFCIFILSYLLSFLVFSIFEQPGPFRFLQPHPYPYLQAKTGWKLCGRTKEEWITGTWMKGGGPCYSSWMFYSMITFPFPSVDPLPPDLPWPWRYFISWNLSRDDMSLPSESIIFSPTSWNADVMTGAGTAIWDQR